MLKILLSFFFGFGLIANAQTYADSTNVLFIGNSITYYNSMPYLLKKIANTKNKKVAFDQYTPGGTGFVDHVNDPQAYQKIRSRIWDYVVLQPGSGESIASTHLPLATANRGKILKDSILKHSPCAKIFLYEIPYGVVAPDGFPVYFERQQRIKDSMTKVCQLMQIPMIPAGEAVKLAYTTNQNDFLHVGYNDIHPNAKGSFIIAATIFSNLFQENASGANYYGEVGANNAPIYFGYADNVGQSNLNSYFTNLYPRAQFLTTANQNQIQFTSTSNLASHYHWDFGDGQTSNEQHPTHTYLQNGNYEITLRINSNNCPIKVSKWIQISTLATQENTKKRIQLYPNPSNGNFKIELNDSIISYKIIDALGRIIIDKQVNNAPKSIEIHENLAIGNYWIRIKTSTFEINKYIQIQK